MPHSTHRRLPCETHALVLKTGEGAHHLDVSFVWTPPDFIELHEIAFVGRGKIGQGIDQMFIDLGVQLSRALQGRDPQTGEPLPEEKE